MAGYGSYIPGTGGRTVRLVVFAAETELNWLLAVHRYSPLSSCSVPHISNMDSLKVVSNSVGTSRS